MVKSIDTEQKILNAAHKVFIRKGMAGARMQEIADEAGINKALLHYYFRSKDRLFDKIFEDAFKLISSGIGKALETDEPILQKLRKFIDFYVDVLIANPYIPAFVIGEINHNPERLEKIIVNEMSSNFESFFFQVIQEINKGEFIEINPAHLMLNILGMLLFPFIARPIIFSMMSQYTDIDYLDFLKQRKEVVYDFTVHALLKNKL
jgi:TetR/AcrR family transcriptional regulator